MITNEGEMDDTHRHHHHRHEDGKQQRQQQTPEEEYLDEHFPTVEYLLRVCSQLKLSSLSKATACMLYHKAQVEQKKLRNISIDNYLVAPTCVYLASKIGEEALKIRDLVNVSYRVLHPGKEALEIGTTYWKLRDSITTCELMLLRLFAFNVNFKTPHKYVLHYLKSLEDWTSDLTSWKKSNICTISWTLVNDLCYLPLVVSTPPQTLALAVIYIALKKTQLSVLEDSDERTWYKVFSGGSTTEEQLLDISCRILQLYRWKDKRDSDT